MSNLVIKSKIKEASELAVSEEFIEELDKIIAEEIKQAEKRAKANSRRTLLARDL